MQVRRVSPLLLLVAVVATSCAPDVESVLSEDGTRSRAIDALLADPAMRLELVDRVLGSTEGRATVAERIVQDDEAAAAVVDAIVATDRGKAIAVTRIATDVINTRAFLSMMMSTGAVGAIVGQDGAECLGLGDPFADGNQRKTMADLKRLGRAVDAWAAGHGGSYPVCDRLEDVGGCLASVLPEAEVAGLPLIDAWGRPFHYRSDERGTSYTLVSYATDGRYDGLGRVGPTSSRDADIVYADGEFVQWPGHIRKDEVR